jgi:fluoroacetyl-CoA thioesterase
MTEPPLEIGMSTEVSQKVTHELSAPHIGSGDLIVYATPAMAAFVERACARMVAKHLPEGQTTVGVEIHVHHLAPTPVGADVRLRAEVVRIDGKEITFEARIYDEVELVGEAYHRRVIIDEERFLQRVRSKAAKSN